MVSGSDHLLPKAPLDQASIKTANACMMIYKIFRADEWSDMQSKGQSNGAPVDLADGFIHFSTAEQVHGTLAKHFAGEDRLTLLACDADRMGDDLRWEPSRGGDLFPHLYRSLTMADISWSREIITTPDGHDTGPLG